MSPSAGAPRVVAFGELLLRLSPPGEQRLFDSPELQTFFGGAEANVAVALSHLGLEADYVTRLPEGPLGDAALDALRREGVGTASILRGGARMDLCRHVIMRCGLLRKRKRAAAQGDHCHARGQVRDRQRGATQRSRAAEMAPRQ